MTEQEALAFWADALKQDVNHAETGRAIEKGHIAITDWHAAAVRAIVAAADREREMARTWGGIPLVPAIWPFGENALVTGYGVENGLGVLMVRPITDDFAGAVEGTERQAWEAGAGMQLTLTFKSEGAVKILVGSLNELATAIRSNREEGGRHE